MFFLDNSNSMKKPSNFQTFGQALLNQMECYSLGIPRLHRHETFCLIYMDLKSPLDGIKHAERCGQTLILEIISVSMNSVTLFEDISNLFPR